MTTRFAQYRALKCEGFLDFDGGVAVIVRGADGFDEGRFLRLVGGQYVASFDGAFAVIVDGDGCPRY